MSGGYFIYESFKLWFLLMNTSAFGSPILWGSVVLFLLVNVHGLSLTYLSIGFPILHSNSY